MGRSSSQGFIIDFCSNFRRNCFPFGECEGSALFKGNVIRLHARIEYL